MTAALVIGDVIGQNISAPTPSDCNSNYAPCVPVAPDLSRSEIHMVVQVTGEDPNGLNGDGDGYDCDIYR